jgi:hypothetical protein
VQGGEAFTDAQRQDINRAVAEAEKVSGWTVCVYLGATDVDGRGYAEAMHAQLPNPGASILVQVDPERRTLEIVSGAQVRRHLDNRSAALAAVTMQSAFAAGDLARGLVIGLQQIAELARVPRNLHTDTP